MTQSRFLFLVIPLQERMFRLAFSFLRDEDDAKDVVQDTVVKLWQKRETLSRVESVEAWCIRVARNTILDRLTRNKHRKTIHMQKHQEIMAGTTAQGSIEARDTANSIQKIISRLPEKYRFFIHLRDVEGFAYHDIAQIMEVSMPEVKVGIFRARQAVREQLKNLDNYGLQ